MSYKTEKCLVTFAQLFVYILHKNKGVYLYKKRREGEK